MIQRRSQLLAGIAQAEELDLIAILGRTGSLRIGEE